MHPLEKKITNLLQEQPLFAACRAVVIGVSGGPDSVALLHVLAACLTDTKIIAVYVNHGLRPAETGAEEELVRQQAQQLAVDFECGEVDVRTIAATRKISIEHSARELRYAFLREIAAQYGTERIAVAHTADDQAEELLLRMIRGAGRRGLAGMDYLNNDNIARPFLDIEKAELLAYLADKKIPHAQDSSNVARVYLRNRVRLDLIPFLEEGFNPGVKNNLHRLATILRAEEGLLDDISSQAFAATVRQITPVIGVDDYCPGLEINISKFNGLHLATRRRLVEKIFLQLKNEPSFQKIEQVLFLAKTSGEAGAHFSQGLRMKKQGDTLRFSYPQGRTNRRGNLGGQEDDFFEIQVAGPGAYDFAGRTIYISLVDKIPASAELKNADANYFDYDSLTFPVIIRSPKAGDNFYPFGGPGVKKVNDFLVDLKLGKARRPYVPIVISTGKIVGLLGLRTDNRFGVGSTTVRAVKFVLS